ncbi:hypothetical protein DEAB109302_13410 [Dermacoccus abyssi]
MVTVTCMPAVISLAMACVVILMARVCVPGTVRLVRVALLALV